MSWETERDTVMTMQMEHDRKIKDLEEQTTYLSNNINDIRTNINDMRAEKNINNSSSNPPPPQSSLSMPLYLNGELKTYPGCSSLTYVMQQCPNGEYTSVVNQDSTCNGTIIEKCVIEGNTIYDNTENPTFIKKSDSLNPPMPLSIKMTVSKNSNCSTFDVNTPFYSALNSCTNKHLKLDVSQDDKCNVVFNENTCTDPNENFSNIYNFKSKKERKIENFSENGKCKARY
jgi:hypothetical protein